MMRRGEVLFNELIDTLSPRITNSWVRKNIDIINDLMLWNESNNPKNDDEQILFNAAIVKLAIKIFEANSPLFLFDDKPDVLGLESKRLYSRWGEIYYLFDIWDGYFLDVRLAYENRLKLLVLSAIRKNRNVQDCYMSMLTEDVVRGVLFKFLETRSFKGAYQPVRLFYNKSFITKRNRRHKHFKKKNIILFEKKDPFCNYGISERIYKISNAINSKAQKTLFRLIDTDTI
jgi:hypothetical protein